MTFVTLNNKLLSAREKRNLYQLIPYLTEEPVNLFRITKEITRDLRWIHVQSLPDLRVISAEIARKLGAIPERIRQKLHANLSL